MRHEETLRSPAVWSLAGDPIGSTSYCRIHTSIPLVQSTRAIGNNLTGPPFTLPRTGSRNRGILPAGSVCLTRLSQFVSPHQALVNSSVAPMKGDGVLVRPSAMMSLGVAQPGIRNGNFVRLARSLTVPGRVMARTPTLFFSGYWVTVPERVVFHGASQRIPSVAVTSNNRSRERVLDHPGSPYRLDTTTDWGYDCCVQDRLCQAQPSGLHHPTGEQSTSPTCRFLFPWTPRKIGLSSPGVAFTPAQLAKRQVRSKSSITGVTFILTLLPSV